MTGILVAGEDLFQDGGPQEDSKRKTEPQGAETCLGSSDGAVIDVELLATVSLDREEDLPTELITAEQGEYAIRRRAVGCLDGCETCTRGADERLTWSKLSETTDAVGKRGRSRSRRSAVHPRSYTKMFSGL